MRPLALAAVGLLAACNSTFPWTSQPSERGADVPPPGGGSAEISVPTTALSFGATVGGDAPAPQTVQIGIVNGPVTVRAIASGAAVASATVVTQTPTSATVEVRAPAPAAAGTFTGSVEVRGCLDEACTQQAAGSPRTVPVTFAVAASSLTVAPAGLSFEAVAGAGPSAAQTVEISNADGAASWSASATYSGAASGWLDLSPPSGAALPASVSVTASFPETTPPGTYAATLRVTSLGTTRTIAVTATVERPRVLAATAALALAAVRDQTPLPDAVELELATEHGGALAYTTQITYGDGVGWLSAPASGTAPGQLALGASRADLAPGRYEATLAILPANGAPATSVSVTYDVAPPPFAVAPASLSFILDASTDAAGTSAALTLTDAGAPLAWTAAASAPWLHVSPSSGTTPSSPEVSLVLAELETLPPGAHAAAVELHCTLSSGATVAVVVPVDLLVELPLVEVVAPRVAVAGAGGELVVHGRGFPQPFGGTVLVGDAAAEAVTSASSTELRVTAPSDLAAGTHLVSVENALGLARSGARLSVIDPVTRVAASVSSPGAKARIVLDDAAGVLYVANAGAGVLERRRAAAGWALAADGSDELALPGLKNLALSPDGTTLLAIAGTTFRLVDTEPFALREVQPAAPAPSDPVVQLEMTNVGEAVYAASASGFRQAGVFDLGSGTTAALPGTSLYGAGLAGGPSGGRVALFSRGLSPAQSIQYWDAGAATVTTTSAAQEGWFGAFDRLGDRLLLFGAWNGARGRRESRLYDAAFELLAGTVPADTRRVVLSPLGRDLAYTWDGASVRVFDLGAAPDATDIHPLLSATAPVASPGADAHLVISADERTAFLAGSDAVVVVPLP